MKKTIHYTLATVFGAGYVPFAPGTVGTLIGVLVAYYFFSGSIITLVIATILVSVIGAFSADFVEKTDAKEDPSKVVIDEVAGMWLSLWFVPLDPLLYAIAFGLFRLFDIAKPYPVRKFEQVHGGWGIMLDDLAAGVYALLVMQIILYFRSDFLNAIAV